jgi:Flp pilus assembly protein TadG
MKKILKFKRNTDGQGLVEFALVFPILMLLVLGMIEFGWILNGKITLTAAGRAGARAAVVCADSTAAGAAATTAVTNSVVGSSLLHPVATVVTFDRTSRIAIVDVTADIKPIIGLYVPNVVNLKVRTHMRIE